jgi:hypothetical protein
MALAEDLDAWVGPVVQAAAAALQSSSLRHAVVSDRERTMQVLAVLQARQVEFVGTLGRALRAELDAAPSAPASMPSTRARRGRLELTLLDEDQIDEEIEVARIVQAIESQCEWELSRLAALCSSLAGRDAISPDANPLQPGAVARAMRRTADGFGLDKPTRLMLLRELGLTAGARLREAYARHAELLEGWGVEPLGYTVRSAPSAAAGIQGAVQQALAPQRSAAAPTPPAADQGALARLVQWAREEARPAPGGELRLLDEVRPVGDEALDAGTAVRVMERLFALLGEQDSLSEHARGLVKRLDVPARRLAAQDPQLWRSLKHPWWQLLDRVVSAGSVQDEIGLTGPQASAASLERVVERLERAPQADAAQCRAALAEADFVITGLLDERVAEVGAEAAALNQRVDRQTVEQHLRDQIIQQLRSTPAPAALRQFLVGPWALALADAALRHGEHAPELRQRAEHVDALIRACAAPPDEAAIATLLAHSRQALLDAAFPPARVDAELTDLEAILRRPPPPDLQVPEPEVEPLPVPEVLGLHDGLPTVPIDTVEGDAMSAATLDRNAWLDSLEPGHYCRLYLLERWMTTQLTWRSRNRSMFVFTSRHAGRVHSLTRRALEKLRAAGLAATIEHGQLIAQAMDTLSHTRPMPD